MLINRPDNKEDNVLMFTQKEKKIIFNKYKVSNKKGAQGIHIDSAPLIKILEEHLKKHPNQKYLLMRNDKALNDIQIREVIRTEMGLKETCSDDSTPLRNPYCERKRYKSKTIQRIRS